MKKGGRRWWKFWSRHDKNSAPPESRPLREFVYLDEVSLTSLLVSQTGEITDEVQNARSQVEEAMLASSLSASATLVKSEISSRYQTSNTQSMQTTRKANVQSRFREFHEAVSNRIVLRGGGSGPVVDDSNIADILADPKRAVAQDLLTRGSLIELNVELEADPMFRLSNMMSEIVDIAIENPALIGSALPPEVAQIGKVFDRLLTGLVPVRGTCVDVGVVEHHGGRYVFPRSIAEQLGIELEPLTLVGVTDQLAYWKDIRRVLFSKSSFTVLCRLGRAGIQSDWTPVKLADVFRDVVPDMAAALENATEMSRSMVGQRSLVARRNEPLAEAVRKFSDTLVSDLDLEPSAAQLQALSSIDQSALLQTGTVSEQRILFDAVLEVLGAQLEPVDYLGRRRRARVESGLGLFPAKPEAAPSASLTAEHPRENLLDVEFVAIYW